MVLFGTDGIINHITLIIAAIISLGAILFRKNVANDLLDMPFSIIGAIAVGSILTIIIQNMFDAFKWALLAGIVGCLVGGFIGGNFLGDGESDNSGGKE